MADAGPSVGGCSSVAVVTMEESESKRLSMGEGGSLGGVTSKEGEVDGEPKEGGNWSLSLNTEMVSGPEGNPDKMEKLLFLI